MDTVLNRRANSSTAESLQHKMVYMMNLLAQVLLIDFQIEGTNVLVLFSPITKVYLFPLFLFNTYSCFACMYVYATNTCSMEARKKGIRL